MTYQKFIGKVAIKSEISHYLFNKFTQWYFNNNLDKESNTSVSINARPVGNKVIHVIFPHDNNTKCIYYGMQDTFQWVTTNLCLFINGNDIELRIYFPRDEQFTFSHPLIDWQFDYMKMLENKKLITIDKGKPIIDDKKAINNLLQDNLVDPIINMLDYVIKNKAIPAKYNITDDDGTTSMQELVNIYYKDVFEKNNYVIKLV